MESIDPISTAATFFMDDCCRACTNRRNTISMKRLFCPDDHDDETDILKLFSLWTSLEVNQTDGLPAYLCDECYKLIIEFKQFRIMCRVSDGYFRSKINSKREFHHNIVDGHKDYDNTHDTDFKTVILSSTFENDDQVNNARNVIHEFCHSILEETIHSDIVNAYHTHTDIKNEINYDLEINPNDEHLNKIRDNKSADDVIATVKIEDCKKNIECIENNEDIKLSSFRNLMVDKPIKKVKKNGNNKNIKLQCEKCSKAFFKKHRLEGHLRQHLGLKPCLCLICGKTYGKWSGLKSHITNTHSDVKSPKEYICNFPECKKMHYSHQALTAHKRLAHNHTVNENCNAIIIKPRLICERCGKSFRTNGLLIKHRYTHTGLKPFQCKLCPKKFPSNHKLKEHTMRHEGIKNHVCSFCGLRKTTAYELKVHVNYHTREKLHNCKYCSMVFTTVSNMSLHIRTVHCRIKAYSCTYCDRSFAIPGTLKHHIMTHTGEKPHVCSVCGKRFIQSYSLKAHLKTHDNKSISNKSKHILSEPQ